MIASAPECRQYRDCLILDNITGATSDIAAADGIGMPRLAPT